MLIGSLIVVTCLSVTKDSCLSVSYSASVHHLMALEGCTSAIATASIQLAGRGRHEESEAFPSKKLPGVIPLLTPHWPELGLQDPTIGRAGQSSLPAWTRFYYQRRSGGWIFRHHQVVSAQIRSPIILLYHQALEGAELDRTQPVGKDLGLLPPPCKYPPPPPTSPCRKQAHL